MNEENWSESRTYIIPDRVPPLSPLRPVMVTDSLQVLRADSAIVSHEIPAQPLGDIVWSRSVGPLPRGSILSGPEIPLRRPVVISPNISDNSAHFYWSMVHLNPKPYISKDFLYKTNVDISSLIKHQLNGHFGNYEDNRVLQSRVNAETSLWIHLDLIDILRLLQSFNWLKSNKCVNTRL
jgi:hypothetical protein